MKYRVLLYSSIVAFSAPTALNAALVTLGGPLPGIREASLTSATGGTTGSGNATVTDVQAWLGGTWTERASVQPGNSANATQSNGMLKVVLSSGTWGTVGPLVGTWEITNASFFSTYGSAAMSIHVGNGNGDPDHFIWSLTPGLLTGNWTYNGNSPLLGGGGFSNFKLYSSGTGTPGNDPIGGVPDGGTTLFSLGLALFGLGSMRKLISAKA